MSEKLLPGGVFGLWSDEPPAKEFTELLDFVFDSSAPHENTFSNPYTGGDSTNTEYLARKAFD